MPIFLLLLLGLGGLVVFAKDGTSSSSAGPAPTPAPPLPVGTELWTGPSGTRYVTRTTSLGPPDAVGAPEQVSVALASNPSTRLFTLQRNPSLGPADKPALVLGTESSMMGELYPNVMVTAMKDFGLGKADPIRPPNGASSTTPSTPSATPNLPTPNPANPFASTSDVAGIIQAALGYASNNDVGMVQSAADRLKELGYAQAAGALEQAIAKYKASSTQATTGFLPTSIHRREILGRTGYRTRA